MADLNIETSNETTQWRQKKLTAWAQLRKDRDAKYKAASKTKTSANAKQYAADQIRGPTREFIYDILRRTSQSAALDFLRNMPLGALSRTEKLLDELDLVPRLIRRSYPAVMPWAQNIRIAENSNVRNNSQWAAWMRAIGEPLGYEISLEATVVDAPNPLITKAIKLGPYIVAAVPYVLAAGLGTAAAVVVLRGDKRNGS